MRWAELQRIEFIRVKIATEGKINRSDLIEQFRISMPQASNDLRKAAEIYKGLMKYDAIAKTYVTDARYCQSCKYWMSGDYLGSRRCEYGGWGTPSGRMYFETEKSDTCRFWDVGKD